MFYAEGGGRHGVVMALAGASCLDNRRELT